MKKAENVLYLQNETLSGLSKDVFNFDVYRCQKLRISNMYEQFHKLMRGGSFVLVPEHNAK